MSYIAPSHLAVRPATIPELALLMDHFRQKASAGASIDQLAGLLEPIMYGHRLMMRYLAPGTRLFRGRIVSSPPTHLRDVGYPPAVVVAQGRANRAGQPVLYVTTSDNAVAFETRAAIGNMLAAVQYEVTAELSYMALGYTKLAASRLEATRDVPAYGLGLTTDRETFVEEFLAEIFTPLVNGPDDEWRYRASIAVAENFFHNDLADALLFPTVSMRADGDNLAIRTRFADRGLKAVSVSMWEKVADVAPFQVEYSYRDVSEKIGKRGEITWHGSPAFQLTRPGEWVVLEARDGSWHIKHHGVGSMPEGVVAQPTDEPGS
jgi:hypothetical protein